MIVVGAFFRIPGPILSIWMQQQRFLEQESINGIYLAKKNISSTCPRHGSGALPGIWGKWGQLRGGGLGRAWPPKEAGMISSQCSARAETTWRRKKRDGQVGCNEEGPAQTEWAIFQDEDFLIITNCALCWSNLISLVFQENKSYGVKPIAWILCLHVAVHHIPNSTSADTKCVNLNTHL